MALSGEVQKPKGSLMSSTLISAQIPSYCSAEESKTIPRSTDRIEDQYPDLYLPVTENYKISNRLYGYTDSVSMDNNPMILVELTGLCYRYGTTIYAVHRVKGTMYGKLSVGTGYLVKEQLRNCNIGMLL